MKYIFKILCLKKILIMAMIYMVLTVGQALL